MTSARALVRILATLLALVLGSAGVNQAFASPERIRATHAYNATWTTAPTSERAVEGGPPAHVRRDTSYDSDGLRLFRVSARPNSAIPSSTRAHDEAASLLERAHGNWALDGNPGGVAAGLAVVQRSDVAAKTEGFVYRGVARDHPGYDDALRGNAVPRNVNGSTTAEAHNFGNPADLADSPYTSWTRDPAIARRFAGDDGVILRLPTGAPPAGSTWKFEWSPDVWFEQEVLVRGPVFGAGRIQ